jgi:hypothetical protein
MLVSHRRNFIYTKTFKTAGTSVEVHFEPYCVPVDENWTMSHGRDERVSKAGIVGYRGSNWKQATWWNHMPAREIRDRLGPDKWESYFKFCVVRNPFDKAVSNFYYTTGEKNPKGWFQQAKWRVRSAFRQKSVQFLQFEFERWLWHGGLGVDRDKYMIDGEFCVDDFIFFEHLEEDVRRICERLSLPFDSDRLPRLKTSQRPKTYSTHEHYTPAAVEMVASAFDVEIETFGYAFPDGGTTAAPAPEVRP